MLIEDIVVSSSSLSGDEDVIWSSIGQLCQIRCRKCCVNGVMEKKDSTCSSCQTWR